MLIFFSRLSSITCGSGAWLLNGTEACDKGAGIDDAELDRSTPAPDGEVVVWMPCGLIAAGKRGHVAVLSLVLIESRRGRQKGISSEMSR